MEERRRTIGAVLPDLFATWGETDRLQTLYLADIELTRLALVSGNLDVLTATAFFAIQGMRKAFANRDAAATTTAALNALEGAERVPEITLLRAAAEIFADVGDPDGLRRVFANAKALGGDDPSQSVEIRLARAQFRLRYGGYLWRMGQPGLALGELRAALGVFESFGEHRSRAITLSAIAQIMTDKGDVEAALALQQEGLHIWDTLGDRSSRAKVLGDIARIMRAKGKIEVALALHQDALQIFEALGERRSRAITLGDIAHIMTDKGEVETALALHQELREVFDAMGDQRSRASTLNDIAQIRRGKGDYDVALWLEKESLKIMRQLGDQDGIANATFGVGMTYLYQSVEATRCGSFAACNQGADRKLWNFD
jgi:tetratricopeptide (TPR) repeat protein